MQEPRTTFHEVRHATLPGAGTGEPHATGPHARGARPSMIWRRARRASGACAVLLTLGTDPGSHAEPPPAPHGAPHTEGAAATSAAEWSQAVAATADPGPWQSAIERVTGAWAALPEGRLALRVDVVLRPGWHTYWQNPGESGDAPAFAWTLPEGWTAHEVLYPRPEAKILDDAPFFGYEGRATYVLVVRPERSPGAAPEGGAVGERGTVPERDAPTPRWKVVATILACKERCVLGAFTLEGSWPPAVAAAPLDLARQRFNTRMLPMTATHAGVHARLEGEVLHIEGPSQGRPTVRFIPERAPGLALGGNATPEGAVHGPVRDGRFALVVPLERSALDERGARPDAAGLVLLGDRPEDPAVAVRVSSGSAGGREPAGPTPKGAAAGGSTPPPPNARP